MPKLRKKLRKKTVTSQRNIRLKQKSKSRTKKQNAYLEESMLRLESIHYSVEGKKILKGVSLEIREGELFSVVGVNGTGKTTLAAILMGLGGYKPTSGKIFFKGKNITRLSTTERARLGITLAWQIPASFEGLTVKEYMTLNREADPGKYLKLVGLDPELYLDRTLDNSLSGGERKRIELASVFSIKPKLVILDEPDSGIDMASINAIKRVIKGFRKNNGSVMLITHSERMARVSDRAVLLCSGRIIKKGNPKNVTNFFRKYCKECNHVGEIEEGVLK